MNPFLKVPTRYWFLSCMGALWFAMGALDYVMISYKIPAYMETMPEDLRYWFGRRPVWFTGVWAISVWSALLGSFLLLLRRMQALRLFVRSGQYGAYASYNNSYFQWFNSFFLGIFYIFLPAIHSDGRFALDGAGQSCVIGLIAIAPCALVRRSSAVCGC
jgi:hypothetical protein